MADVVSFKISGLREIEDKLDHAPLKASRRILRESLRPAAEIWAQDMRMRVRRGPHVVKGMGRQFAVIANAIRTRLSVTSDLEATARVGPGRHEYWARFLERGTAPRNRGLISGYYISARGTRLRTHSGASTGTMPAIPFMQPTFDSRKDEVLATFIADVRIKLAEAGLPVQ